MDPVAKRFMWDVIAKIASAEAGCSVVLTTHSMEECEALCGRVGIMVGGRLRCLGSAPHLKTRFGQGHMLELKLKTNQGGAGGSPREVAELREEEAAVAAAMEWVATAFEDTTLLERSERKLRFRVGSGNLSLGAVFERVEAAKAELELEDYAVSQTSLEQIFNTFAAVADAPAAHAVGDMAVPQP